MWKESRFCHPKIGCSGISICVNERNLKSSRYQEITLTFCKAKNKILLWKACPAWKVSRTVNGGENNGCKQARLIWTRCHFAQLPGLNSWPCHMPFIFSPLTYLCKWFWGPYFLMQILVAGKAYRPLTDPSSFCWPEASGNSCLSYFVHVFSFLGVLTEHSFFRVCSWTPPLAHYRPTL